MVATIAPPNLGNNGGSAGLLAKPEWTPVSRNQDNAPKNTENLKLCVDAIVHDIMKVYWSEVEDVFACLKTDVPLVQKIQQGRAWREGDDASIGLTLANLGARAIPAPKLLINGNGTGADEATPPRGLTSTSGNLAFYAANAPGSTHTLPAASSPVVWGLRTHKSRWYWVDQPPADLNDDEMLISCTVRIPHWNQANTGGYVALCWGNVTNENQTGADRGWEFGLGAGNDQVDPGAHPNDCTLYFKFWDTNDDPHVIALQGVAPNSAFGLVPGGEYTIGAFLQFGGGTQARWFINGIEQGSSSLAADADIAVHGDMSLIVGSRQAGNDYIGAIRNVYADSKSGPAYAPTTLPEEIALALYKLGAGY